MQGSSTKGDTREAGILVVERARARLHMKETVLVLLSSGAVLWQYRGGVRVGVAAGADEVVVRRRQGVKVGPEEVTQLLRAELAAFRVVVDHLMRRRATCDRT